MQMIKLAVAAGMATVFALSGCGKKADKKDDTTKVDPKMEPKMEPKKDEPPAGSAAAKPGSNWPKLTAEQCDKAARKQNIECAIKGAPPPKDPEGMIKMAVETCSMDMSSMPAAAVVFQAQVACADKATCDEFKSCVSAKETELKAELKK